jgi:hypothetical protein
MPFKDDCPFKIGDRVHHANMGDGTVIDPDLIPKIDLNIFLPISDSVTVWLELDVPSQRSKYYWANVDFCKLCSGVIGVKSGKFCKCSDSKPILILVSIICDKCGKEVKDAF